MQHDTNAFSVDAVEEILSWGSNSNKTYFYVADWEAYESYDKNKMYKEATVYVDGLFSYVCAWNGKRGASGNGESVQFNVSRLRNAVDADPGV